MNKEAAYITFGSQMGDAKAAEIVQPHLIELRKLLKIHCNNPYVKDIEEFALIARVDGDIWHWEFEGCERLRLNKKGRYITIDIGMPRNRWVGVQPLAIKQYLFSNLKTAIQCIIEKLKKEKYSIEEVELFKDLDKVEEIYYK